MRLTSWHKINENNIEYELSAHYNTLYIGEKVSTFQRNISQNTIISTEYIFDNDLCKYHRVHTPTATNSKIAKHLPMNTSQHPLHIL